MKGRLENRLKLECKIKKLISNQPYFVQDYAYNLLTGEATTADKYLVYVTAFLSYMREINIYDGTIEGLKRIQAQNIDRYFVEKLQYTYSRGEMKETSNSYKATVWSAINNFFNYMEKQGQLSLNPCSRTKRPSQRDYIKKPVLNKEEIGVFIKNIDQGVSSNLSAAYSHELFRERDMLMFLILIKTGARITGVIELNVEDIDFVNSTITMTSKRRKTREYLLDKDLIIFLNKWLKKRESILKGSSSDALFINKDKQRLTYTGAQKIIKKYSKGLDKNITPHTTRRTVGTTVYNETGDVYLVQELLGHDNISTTVRYIMNNGAAQEKAKGILNSLTQSALGDII